VTEQPSKSEKAIAAELRLRSAPPPVTRLSKKALMVLGTTGCVAIAGAVAFAMSSKPAGASKPEVYDTQHSSPAEALRALPADYTAIPREVPDLGPPLPGDLGEPILDARAGVAPVSGSPLADPAYLPPPPPPLPSAAPVATAPDHTRQLRVQEREAARMSQLFFGDDRRPSPPSVSQEAAAAAPAESGRRGFLQGVSDRQTTSAERLQRPASPYVVQAGSTIPAAIVTGIRGDLPGQVVAQVTQNVFDSPTGRHLLIPQGAKLIGAYDDRIAFGQSRLLLAWTRLILPDGRSLVLERLPAGDAQGYAGLQDGVDRHWRRLAGAALLSTVLGLGAELAADDENDTARAIRRAFGETSNAAGQQVVGRTLDVAPTLTIRPGHPLRVLVTRDLVLEPYPS